MTLTAQRREQIKNILLEHKGKANAISAGEIAKAVGIKEDATVSRTRALITKLVREDDLPIGAYEDGYFYIETQQELTDYVDYLEQKILQTTDRKAKIITNFEKTYSVKSKKTQMDDYW